MSKRLAIRGHSTRGNEVIELLKMMGGKNIHKYDVIRDDYVYFLSEKGSILAIPHCNIHLFDCVIFTLEEFLEKYPFKVGDIINGMIVTKMFWNGYEVTYTFQNATGEEMEEKIASVYFNEITYHKEVELQLGDYEIEVRDGKTYAILKKPKYPKTYKECCDVLGVAPYYNLRYHTYEHCYSDFATSDTLLSLEDKLNTLGKLLICRDAYWKIAGEQMGLGKPWEPVWDGVKLITKYAIFDHPIEGWVRTTTTLYKRVLVFPTPEMRDEFYKNFKELIEKCKQFL